MTRASWLIVQVMQNLSVSSLCLLGMGGRWGLGSDACCAINHPPPSPTPLSHRHSHMPPPLNCSLSHNPLPHQCSRLHTPPTHPPTPLSRTHTPPNSMHTAYTPLPLPRRLVRCLTAATRCLRARARVCSAQCCGRVTSSSWCRTPSLALRSMQRWQSR